MKSVEQIQAEINELNDKLGVVNASIEKKEKELAGLKSTHRDIVSRNAGKLHQPASIKTNRAAIAQAETELDDLNIAQASLQESLKQTTELLELAVIYNQVADIREDQHLFLSSFYAIYENNIVGLKNDLIAFQEKVAELKKTPNPTMRLEVVLKELAARGLSFKALIEDGEIKPADPTADDNFLDSLRSTFRKPLNLMRDLVLPNINQIGSDLINILSWADGSQLKEYQYKEPKETSGLINPVKQAVTNTVEFINPLTRNPDYWVKLEQEKKAIKHPQPQ